jgi:EamA-like transporter family.
MQVRKALAQDTEAYSGVFAMNLSLYLLTVLIWGTTWIALKWQLGVVAIPVSIVYRFGLAALVLFVMLLLSRRLQVMNRRGHLICLAQGLCLFCINFMCFLTASQWIPVVWSRWCFPPPRCGTHSMHACSSARKSRAMC